MANARETLKKAGKEFNNYKDDKYVKTACGTAYNGMLEALDGYLLLKEVPKRKGRKSIEYYTSNLAQLNKKLLSDVNNAYSILHLSGYYDGVTYVPAIQAGFELADTIIKQIEP
jgi:uncharacterized protein (UPF0332 family)